MVIRNFEQSDAAAFRRCVVEMQEFERMIDSRLRPGEAIADEYCEQIHAHCRDAAGRVFVAELDGVVVGFVAVVSHEPFTELDQPPGHYALVTDLAVLELYRGRGIGRELLRKAEEFVRDAGATEFRIGVLANNSAARRVYLGADFVPYLEIFVKRW